MSDVDSNNVHTARVVEYYPRILQIAYTSTLCEDSRGIPPITLTGCDKPLTVMEADLVVDRILPGGIVYFHHSYLQGPVLNGVMSIVVRQWNRIYDRGRMEALTPYQTEDRYCPYVWIASIYAPNEALIYGPRGMLYLEDRAGSVYEFPLSDIGSKLMPVIEECYLTVWNRV